MFSQSPGSDDLQLGMTITPATTGPPTTTATTTTNNNSDNSDNLILEWAIIQFPLYFQLTVTIGGIVAIVLNAMTMLAMANTTRILYASRFMSIGLSMFDLQYTASAIAFVWSYGVMSRGITFSISIMWVGLCYLNVCMMSVERYVALRHPYTYIKFVSNQSRVGRAILTTWGILVILYLVNYYGVCSYFSQWPMSVRFCKVNNIVNGVFIVILTTISAYCNINVYILISADARKTKNAVNMKDMFKHSKTHMATCVLFSSNLCTYGVVFVVTLCSSLGLLPTITLYTLIVAIHLVNSFTDPLIYAMWYKECRYKLYHILSFCSAHFRETSDAMKLEVYGIVTTDSYTRISERPTVPRTNGTHVEAISN